MQIIPAIDLIDNKCVRLIQGDYNQKTIFNDDPLQVAKDFVNSGASLVHIVDLDGAKAGQIINTKTIQSLCDNSIPIEVGGGIRTDESISMLLSLGVKRVILGSIAVTNQEFLKDAIKKYGKEKIVLGLDCKGDYVSIHGWQNESQIKCIDLLDVFKSYGGETVIYTDISKDGMMSGANIDELKKLVVSGLKIIASGGVSSLDEVKKCKEIGCAGAIIGKAYYLGKINIADAINI